MIDAKLLVMDKLQSGLFDSYLQKLCLLSQEKILWFLDNKKGRYWSLSANSDFEDMPICKKREKERNFFPEVTSDNTSFFFLVQFPRDVLSKWPHTFPKYFPLATDQTQEL